MLAAADGLDAYLRIRCGPPRAAELRERADTALRAFLEQVFADRTEFGFDPERFEGAYLELELALYEGNAMTTIIAPLLGVALEPTTNLVPLGDGLSLQSGDSLTDAPSDAVWGEHDEPNVLIVLCLTAQPMKDPPGRSPTCTARMRFRSALTALRLFERGGYALGPLAWLRADTGVWRPFALGSSGRPRGITVIPAEEEDELRAFCSLIARPRPARASSRGRSRASRWGASGWRPSKP
jgi:hypothetical protein